MRICFITPTYALTPPFGGIATHIRTMARWLARQGHDIHVVCPVRDRKPAKLNDQGVQVHLVAPKRIQPRRILNYLSRIPGLTVVREAYFGWNLLENSRGAWHTVRHLEQQKPFDVIQCGDYKGLAIWGVWPRKRHQRIVLRGQGLLSMYPVLVNRPGGKFHHLLETICAQRADFILANSHYVKQCYSEQFGVVGEKIDVLYRPYEFDDQARQKPVDEQPLTILYVGRIEADHKGVDILLEALPKVHASLPRVRVSFVGNVQNNLAKRFETFLNESHTWVTYHGPLDQPDVFKQMRQSSILVLPSRDEAAGGVLVEAQFCGLPQVATRVGGSPELVRDGVTGLLVEPDNSDALAEAIIQLVQTPELLVQMSKRSQQNARTQFDIDATMNQYVCLLEELIAVE